MKMLKISEIPGKLSNGIRVMHDSDLRVDVETADYWTRDTEAEYNAVTDKLDRLNMKGKGYQIYVWYDVSGFDYWVINMQEENYA